VNSLRIIVVLRLANINKGHDSFVNIFPTLAEGVNTFQLAVFGGTAEDLAVVDGLREILSLIGSQEIRRVVITKLKERKRSAEPYPRGAANRRLTILISAPGHQVTTRH
jgi:hypothetical protein